MPSLNMEGLKELVDVDLVRCVSRGMIAVLRVF